MIPASLVKAFVCLVLAAFVAGISEPLEAGGPQAARPAVHLDSHKASSLLLHGEEPHYPPIAAVNYIQGVVKLQITVDPQGRVSAVHVVDGEPILAATAIEAVQKWLYRPYHSSGGAVPFTTNVSVKFVLRHKIFGSRFPRHPEADLARQIRPPQVIVPPELDESTAGVKLKVLVGASGKVLDAVPMEAKSAGISLAREYISRWHFRPARWGALAVPWYVVVKVPVQSDLAEKDTLTASH